MEFTDYDTRLAAYAVVVRDEHVLLALWNEPEVPMWTLPGGGVELHESPEAGAIREVREETGYDVTLGRPLGVATQAVPPGGLGTVGDRWLCHVWTAWEATVVGGELTAETDGTTDEARWVPLADLPGLDRTEQVRKFVG